MTEPLRSQEEFSAELASLDAAHNQNESLRDSFIGLAHTALFAASISFVADLFPAGQAELIWLVIMAWISSCVGLISFTFSFSESRKAIDARREALNDVVAPRASKLEALNAVSLWTFPISLIAILIFASVNLVKSNDEKEFGIEADALGLRDIRSDPSVEGASLQSKTDSRNGSSPSTKGSRTLSTNAKSIQEIENMEHQRQ